MRLKTKMSRHLILGACLVILLASLTSAITVKSLDKRNKRKAEEKVKFLNNDNAEASSQKLLERQGFYAVLDDHDQLEIETLDSKELVKKTENITEPKSTGKRNKKEKEHSPANVDVIPPAELGMEDNSDEEGERLAKADVNRERGDKNPRIYYDDAAPRFPPGHSQSPYEHFEPEAKSKDGKIYFPKHYLNNKYSPGPKKGQKPSFLGLSGKRIPDHIHFDEGGHEFSPGHSHQHSVVEHDIGHEEHEHDVPIPHSHGIEEHHGKSHHHTGYGYHPHHGSFRHTIGDKVDVVGKALQVLLPSALFITGVSALFPNRVHVPTTPNKYRQKRSAIFRRRVSSRGMEPARPLPRMPAAHIPPELEDIPTHILRAEHRIMDGSPSELYPEYGQRYGASSSAESSGFNPFKVFKGPGPETQVIQLQNAIPMPPFPNYPEMTPINIVNLPQGVGASGEQTLPQNNFVPVPLELEEVPPTVTNIIPQSSPPTANLDDMQITDFAKQRQNLPLRRRKPVRKTAQFLKEAASKVQQSSESQKSQYLVKNELDDSNMKLLNQVKAEKDFMSSLQNLVTPDVAKAIVENKQETPRDVDLSPDGPVMGLLTSYAQHEKDTPQCQKRALCELAVKGKSPKSTKFEAFLWSVATLVPDVFSEMYDLQEVFQAIRDEGCNGFACANPNMDLQA